MLVRPSGTSLGTSKPSPRSSWRSRLLRDLTLGNPNWRPIWTEEVRYQNEVSKIFWEQFYAKRQVANLNSGAADVLEIVSRSQSNLMATLPRRPIELTVAINAGVRPAAGLTRSNSAKGPK